MIVPVIMLSCRQDVIQDEKADYSFVVAGHVYGHSDHYTSSVYPPFLNQLDSLILARHPNLLILAGDVVAHPTEENWETVRKELDERKLEWVIAPGNHDISLYMDQNIQPFKYKAYREANNLILVLNTSHPGWNPDSLQRNFIKKELQNVDSVNNVFVVSHQLWWLNNPPHSFDLDSIRPNSFAGIDGPTSFWDDVFPYFENLEQEVYFFAGDMGCHEVLKATYEDHHENFHFYGSGMGGGIEDNYFFIETFEDGRVNVKRINF